jgi:multicomponent Na+:H+ antiporter subunit D
LNNQLGFMVVGVGVGTTMAINGAASHAFAHILSKALLFMSMGAILHRVGTTKASELGMLYRSMPWTTFFCVIGALSISAFPLFSGFVTKSMTLTAVANEGWDLTWFVMIFASAGVLHHSGIKIPFYGFFGHHDSGIRCKEAPLNMLLAMGITAFLCVGIGVFPAPLYSILPYPVEFEPTRQAMWSRSYNCSCSLCWPSRSSPDATGRHRKCRARTSTQMCCIGSGFPL